MSRLQPERAARLRAGLRSDVPIESTMSRQREVLDEFECFFQFAKRALPENSSDSAAAQFGATETSADPEWSLRLSGISPSILAAAAATAETSPKGKTGTGESPAGIDVEQIDKAQTRTAASESDEADPAKVQECSMAASLTQEAPRLTGDPMQDLQMLSVHQLAQALGSEQSRTTAILLSHLPARLTGDVLNLLKPDYQKLVMIELTKEQHAPAVLVERIARATVARARQMPAGAPDTRDHADRVAEVLRNVPKAGRRNMLAAIEEQDPELAKSLLTRIYRFDDITSLNKSVIQRVLGEIDSTNLTTALCGAPDEVKNAIFSNLSKRARQTIEEEMQFMTSVAESRVQQARNTIAEIIAKIDMESES